MARSTQQRLALAICDFLSTSLTDGTLSPDEKDSIDVAINCIAESFSVDPTDKAAVTEAIGAQNLLKIYSVYDKLKKPAAPAGAAPSSSAAAPAAGATPSAAAPAAAAAAAPEPTAEQKKQAEALKSKGNAAMASKDYGTAISLYTEALGLHPGNAVFLSNRAAAHSANRDHVSALADAEQATAADPAYTKGWSRLGLARFALGDAKGAAEAYQKGIDHEGNGGSEAMRKGLEMARKKAEEDEAGGEAPGLGAGAAAGARGFGGGSPGGGPDLGGLASLLGGGGGGGAGGMPDLASLMSNPMFASMAQNLMSNPDMMANLMSNPRLRQMADQFTSGGGMPDLAGLMSDPGVAELARNLRGSDGASPGPGAGRGAGGA